MYVVAFLDRANIGFAKEAMQASAGISAVTYAMGAGLFFVTYAVLGVPSNLAMHRIGARGWMCSLMVAWGIISIATMFVHGAISFYMVRLLLGAAEAGFFPGVLLYLTYWFPNRAKAHALALFYFGPPVALMLGGPMSGALLQIPARSGLQGWQWMFLVEGLLAVAVGGWAYVYLESRPQAVSWLTDEQKKYLLEELAGEQQHKRVHGVSAFSATLRNGAVLYYGLIYFLIQVSVYGVVFYLPEEIGAILGKTVGLEVGFVSAVPWACSVLATYWIPAMAGKYRKPRLFAALTLMAVSLSEAMFAAGTHGLAMFCLCIAASGLIAAQPLFWTLPMRYLTDSAAAGGLALISAGGAVGSFLAPNAKVWADTHFGSHQAGLYLLAASSLAAGALMLRARQLEVPVR